jgi:hypothetical protein
MRDTKEMKENRERGREDDKQVLTPCLNGRRRLANIVKAQYGILIALPSRGHLDEAAADLEAATDVPNWSRQPDFRKRGPRGFS